MEKEGRMVFSINKATGTGYRSLCSLRLNKQRYTENITFTYSTDKQFSKKIGFRMIDNH